ncbi:GNAT family N-acetyltransferase [Vibrio sonorensis]|uniref:GNAT family N-acetyltransferase n=1 Tax=Vibrio sonorensis TaxID=1004316 RepID=UPI0008DA1F44|nr:GNAT family N-acetyltransferase [Vibrio sonorensis]
MMYKVEPARLSDAQGVLDLKYQLDAESKFMMLEKGERTTSLEEQKAILKSFESSSSEVMLLAKSESEVVGFVVGIGNQYQRNKHTLNCIIGVLKAASGNGLGKRLMTSLENWAEQNHFTRLELTVMCHNERAIGLYQSQGFVIEGTRKHSLVVDGDYIDEYSMAKLIDR